MPYTLLGESRVVVAEERAFVAQSQTDMQTNGEGGRSVSVGHHFRERELFLLL